MKRVAIGIAVDAVLDIAEIGIESLVGIAALIIVGAAIVAVAIVLQNRADRKAKELNLRLLNVLNQIGR